MITFKPFPYMETENLILRRIEDKDINDIFEMRRDSRMHEYTDTKPDKTLQETKSYIEKMQKGVDESKWIIWAIEHKDSKKVIGSISIWNIDTEKRIGELGYGIISDCRRKGFMKETLLEIVKYGFTEINLRALDAYTEVNNIDSNKLLESCDFIEVDRVEDKGCYNNKIYHMIVYRIKKKN